MEHPWVMMPCVDEPDQFGSYMYYGFLYTNACEVVEEDTPGRHQLFITYKTLTALRSMKHPIINSLPRSTTVTELGIAIEGLSWKGGRNRLTVVYAVIEHQGIK